MTKTTRKPHRETSGNIFIDLGFPPHEAAVMLLRCVAQPRISEIARNKVDKLSLDYLVGLCAKAGVSVKVRRPRSTS